MLIKPHNPLDEPNHTYLRCKFILDFMTARGLSLLLWWLPEAPHDWIVLERFVRMQRFCEEGGEEFSMDFQEKGVDTRCKTLKGRILVSQSKKFGNEAVINLSPENARKLALILLAAAEGVKE